MWNVAAKWIDWSDKFFVTIAECIDALPMNDKGIYLLKDAFSKELKTSIQYNINKTGIDMCSHSVGVSMQINN